MCLLRVDQSSSPFIYVGINLLFHEKNGDISYCALSLSIYAFQWTT